MIIRILVNGKKLFVGVDQGTGKCKNETLLIVGSRGMYEAQIWINNEHMKSFKICDGSNYETSVPETQKNEKEHSEHLEKEIAEEIKEMKMLTQVRKEVLKSGYE